MNVTKAVIPAAGLGTRVLPATKSVPKEMLPIVDRPAIHYIVEEAVRAGITDILIITSRGKSSVEDYFDRAPELEERLLRSGKEALYRQIIAVTQMAMPAAVNGSLLCMEYGGDTECMAQITFISTLASIVTIPIIAALLL